jgi:hypothetical protein
MKITISLFIVLILNVSQLKAQHQFNSWAYITPDGWNENNQRNSVLTITAPDDKSIIMLLPPKPLSGSLQENFRLGWEEYVSKSFGILSLKNGTAQNTADGMQMIVSGWNGNKNGAPLFIYFYTIKNIKQAEYLLILCEGEAGYNKHKQEIDGFMNSFQFNPVKPLSQVAAKGSGPASKENSPAAGKPGVGNFKGSSPSGVYWALTTQLKMGWSINGNGSLNYGTTSGNSVGKDLYFLVLFDDEMAYWWSFLPSKGLFQFDRTNQSFGLYPYKFSANKGSVLTSGKEYSFSANGKELVVGGENYHPLPPVDGLTLDGKWYRADFDKEVKNGTYSFGYLTLKKDGHFSDDGMMEGWANFKPGSGTYEIRDFTLLLNYSDGRKEQLSFYSLQSPVTDQAFLSSREISRLKYQ